MLYTVVNAGVMFIRSSMTAGNLKTPESYEPWKVHLSKLFGIHNVKSGFYRKPLFCENADHEWDLFCIIHIRANQRYYGLGRLHIVVHTSYRNQQ